MDMTKFGSFVLMLHSHLPYYRKHGMWPFGEENLYECMAETYMPLITALNELKEEGVRASITIGITPILAEQLADTDLQQGFADYLQARLTAVSQDIERYPDPTLEHSEHLAHLARYYQTHYRALLDEFENRYQRNLIGALRRLQDDGCIEITTSGATHGFLPLLGTDESIEAQIRVGIETYKRHFGRAPKGIWLPECAYRPAKSMPDVENGELKLRPPIEAFLFENGIEYFFTEYHAIEGSKMEEARRTFGIYGHIKYVPLQERPTTGLTTHEAYWLKNYPVAVMGRSNRASFQVWSAAHGYPGDSLYREFHKKDAESGMHYWRITSKESDLGTKMLYDPALAFEKIKENADHFVGLVYDLAREQHETTGEHNLIMVSFDTELYGHWWFEGVAWLKRMIALMHQCTGLDVETASTYLANHPPRRAISLPESTWGQGGHYWVWNNEHTDWMWPVIHEAEARMRKLSLEFAQEGDTLKVRLLNQALRELLLLQSSDWPFLVTTFQAREYAMERFNRHVENFNQLAALLESGETGEKAREILENMEAVDNPFPNVDYRWFTPPVIVNKAPVDLEIVPS